MRRFINICIAVLGCAVVLSCSEREGDYTENRHLCNFEGAYWDALVDPNPNGDNLVNGTIAASWSDVASGLAGGVFQPYPGYWEGIALSNHCSKDADAEGTYDKQLYAYVSAAYSGDNFLICNGFMSGCVELRFEGEASFIESMMVANTTYSRNTTGNGYRTAERPLAESESIWIEAEGYVNGSESAVSSEKFYLYKSGKPAFEGWKEWKMNSTREVNKVVFHIKWNGTLEYNPYPAYFAVDNIVVVNRTSKE